MGEFHGLVDENSGWSELVDVDVEPLDVVPPDVEPDDEVVVVVVDTVSASCATLLSDDPAFVAYAITVADDDSVNGAE